MQCSRPVPAVRLLLVAALLASWVAPARADDATAPGSAPAFTPKLLIAFASYRDRPKYPGVFFYEHDGVGAGKVVGSIDVSGKRSDSRPSLSLDGRWCAFASEEENQTSRVFMWDREQKKQVELPAINDSPNAQLWPTMTGDGKMLAFAAWTRPDASGLWDVLVYDVIAKTAFPLPGLNTSQYHERTPAFSADGKVLAFTSNAPGGGGLADIRLYDVAGRRVEVPAGLNSPHRDVEPALSRDGALIAFSSDRPGGAGGRDIYLFERATGRLLPLPGLNSVAQEQTPSITADGRFIAFVSERIAGEGERDIFLYDRVRQALLPTPDLNAKQEDFDPCVVVLP